MALFGNENSIEGGQPQASGQRKKDVHEPEQERAVNFYAGISLGPRKVAGKEAPEHAGKPDESHESDAVAKQHGLYTSDKSKTRVYYSDYQQKTEVMRASPWKIQTRLDDRQTIGMMLDLAQSRGWTTVNLRGTEDFKREAWVQARQRGMETQGYRPRATDQQELDRRKEAQAAVSSTSSRSVPESKPTLDAQQAAYERNRQAAWEQKSQAERKPQRSSPNEQQRGTDTEGRRTKAADRQGGERPSDTGAPVTSTSNRDAAKHKASPNGQPPAPSEQNAVWSQVEKTGQQARTEDAARRPTASVRQKSATAAA